MTPGPSRLIIVAGLALGGGCVADFAVGQDNETEAAATGGTTDPSASSITLSGSGSNSGTSASATATSTTSDATTNPVTTEPPTSTTMEVTTEPPTTTMEPTTDPSTTTGTPLECPDLGFKDCEEAEPCIWDGEPEAGECQDDPCFEFEDDCVGNEPKPCFDAEMCTYWEEGKECRHHMCWPCHELTTEGACNEVEPCMWSEAEETCFRVL